MTENSETVTTTETTKNHFGSREHRIAQLKLLSDRVQKAFEVFAGTGVAACLADAKEAVVDAIQEAKSLAVDWKPAGRATSRKAKFIPEAGAKVEIRTKSRAKFADLMTEAEMGDLTVVSVTGTKGKKAVVKTSSGAVTKLPVSQLVAKK